MQAIAAQTAFTAMDLKYNIQGLMPQIITEFIKIAKDFGYTLTAKYEMQERMEGTVKATRVGFALSGDRYIFLPKDMVEGSIDNPNHYARGIAWFRGYNEKP